ncbi:MAG: hypothetical protein JXQ73_09330 [Phycisphaerae bacterium]|nr:hypothetical protein [Phycisphaerae bacterium]
MEGRRILTDPEARSASERLPAFLASPRGAPVYHGFPILEDSQTDGWYLGVITEFEDAAGCEDGDAFVVAPDGSRAGLVWSVGDFDVHEIIGPERRRWGVYGAPFSRPVHNREDIIIEFRRLLPTLRELHRKALARPRWWQIWKRFRPGSPPG